MDIGATLAHEVSGHAYNNFRGNSQYNANRGTWPRRFRSEQNEVAMENEYRNHIGLNQREMYGGNWDMPLINGERNTWSVFPSRFINKTYYIRIPGPPSEWRPR